jgi:hypothetical protein
MSLFEQGVSMHVCRSILSVFAFSSCLLAQNQDLGVDVLSDNKYFTFRGAKSIYQMDFDGSMKELSNLIPENARSIAMPRPKVRFGKIWYSDRKEIYSRPIDATEDEKWEPVKLPFKFPGNAVYFHDFEIISESEAILCGSTILRGTEGEDFGIHFVFDYTTGKVTKTLESFDTAFIDAVIGISKNKGSLSNEMSFNLAKMTASYSCMFHPYVLLVARTGAVIIYDIEKRKERKVEVIPANDLPRDPAKVVSAYGPIHWVSPLSGDEVLLCCRMDAPKADKTNESVTIWVFRTLDLKTGKVELHGTEYLGEKDAFKGPFIEEKGKLISTKKFLHNKGFVITEK